MLKKVGIVVAAATAGLLALSPLAFADDWDHDGEVTNVWIDDNSLERDQVNRCEFEQEILSSGTAGVDAVVTQSQTGNCHNVGDTTVEEED